jgi:hypothetical protein
MLVERAGCSVQLGSQALMGDRRGSHFLGFSPRGWRYHTSRWDKGNGAQKAHTLSVSVYRIVHARLHLRV